MSLDSFVQLVFNVYEAYTVAIFAKDGERLSCVSAFSFSRNFDKAKMLPVDGTLPGWVVKHREPLIIGNFDKDEETLGYYGKKEEIKSFMAHPLDPPGVIIVDSKKKWVFTEKEKKVLAHFVSLLAEEMEKEKQIRDSEEEREQLALTRRIIGLVRESREDHPVLEEVLKESLLLSGGDLCLAGVENRGRIKIIGAEGAGARELISIDSPPHTSIVSTVVEGGRELLLPYESGYLREKPLVFQNDGARTKQFFGFPLIMDEKAYGFLGFTSLSQRRLKEGAIGAPAGHCRHPVALSRSAEDPQRSGSDRQAGPGHRCPEVRSLLRPASGNGKKEGCLLPRLDQVPRFRLLQTKARERRCRRHTQADAAGHRVLHGERCGHRQGRRRPLLRPDNGCGGSGR